MKILREVCLFVVFVCIIASFSTGFKEFEGWEAFFSWETVKDVFLFCLFLAVSWCVYRYIIIDFIYSTLPYLAQVVVVLIMIFLLMWFDFFIAGLVLLVGLFPPGKSSDND